MVLRNRLVNGRVLEARPRGVIMRQGRKLDAEAGVPVLIHLLSGCCPFGPSIRWGKFSSKEERG